MNSNNKLPRNSFRDRDHLLTKDDLFFTVVGNVHPSDRVIAYLKYFPKPDEERVLERAIKHYDIPNIIKTIEILEKNYPYYLSFLEPYSFTFSAVPIDFIRKHFLPEKKLSELLSLSNLDNLSQKAVELASRLSQESSVSLENFGITGSILLGIHNPNFSDIDITVYGKKNSLKVKEALIRIFNNNEETIKRANGEFISHSRERLNLMNEKQLRIFHKRKWNRGTFKGTFFSINPVRIEEEIMEDFGEKRYIPLGLIEIEATVSDSSEDMFIPATYYIEKVSIVKGTNVKGIKEVVSYDRNYGDVAKEGERILCRGKLERVVNRKDIDSYYRVSIGSLEAKGTDYIKLDI